MPSFLESIFGRVSGSRQAVIIAVGIGVTVAVLGVSRWATAPTFVPLYADVPLESVGAMTDKLTEAGISNRLDSNGSTILVASADIAKARVALAREQMPSSGRPGLELFDKPTWGMTDFTQRVNYRRALEGELERTIGRMRGVERVEVHLALEDDKLFQQDARDSKASVTLTMTGGESPTPSTVRGIASLVAGSVGGLTADHVVVVDETGQALTGPDDTLADGLNSRQLAMQREVEAYLERKTEGLVTSIVGTGNARVQVAAAINFDKVERTTQSVDPDQQAISVEHKVEILPQEGQAGASSSNVATAYETTRSVESFSGAIGNVRKLTVAVLVADRVDTPAAIEGEAAPLPVATPRTEAELARIETLVRNALGVDAERGDALSVVSAPFEMQLAPRVVADTLPTPDMLTRVMANPKPTITIAALVVLLIIALVIVKALKAPPQVITRELPAARPSVAGELASPAVESQPDPVIAERKPVVLPAPNISPEREQAVATVEQRPDAALRVMRNWLRT